MAEKNSDQAGIVPPQAEGAKKDIEHTFVAVTESDAKKLFLLARNRLLDVNHWHQYAGPPTSVFTLADQFGNKVWRTAEMGDYFKIDIPAPGPADGKGFDWVRIEAVKDISNPEGAVEKIAMRVRPAADPTQKGENVAHFFSDHATSSFIVERNGKEVHARILGRNETPNIETSNFIDKVRNTLVAATAILGFANIQWKNLLKGIIKAD